MRISNAGISTTVKANLAGHFLPFVSGFSFGVFFGVGWGGGLSPALAATGTIYNRTLETNNHNKQHSTCKSGLLFQ